MSRPNETIACWSVIEEDGEHVITHDDSDTDEESEESEEQFGGTARLGRHPPINSNWETLVHRGSPVVR